MWFQRVVKEAVKSILSEVSGGDLSEEPIKISPWLELKYQQPKYLRDKVVLNSNKPQFLL